MQTLNLPAETAELCRCWQRAGQTIGLVPTMGFLHEGHLSLIRQARARADKVIVSIFVNPTQFGPQEDLDRYPRDLPRDLKLCQDEGADAVFLPTPAAMYEPDFSTWVTEESLTQTLCGASRPGHFRGVTTVVLKLFNLTRCDVAVFGRKDAQQALVISRMVRDLNVPVSLVLAPLIREADGLAMSSRNKFLSADERQEALSLSRGIFAAEQLYQQGERRAAILMRCLSQSLSRTGGRIDYIQVVSQHDLRPLSQINQPALLAAAIFFGQTRLIDNLFLE